MPLSAKKYRKLFSKIPAPNPPADLAQKTILAIIARERKILAAKLFGFGIIFTASIVVVVTQVLTTGTQLGQSGFFEFSSLFFSDFGSVTSNFPDMFFSMLEAFPILSAGLAIGGLAVAIWSITGFIDDANVLRAKRIAL